MSLVEERRDALLVERDVESMLIPCVSSNLEKLDHTVLEHLDLQLARSSADS